MARDILLIHGANAAAWTMLPLAERFAAAGHRCHAPTLRYHDEAPGSPPDPRLAGTGIEDYCEDIARVARDLQTRPVLVGHSMGGVIAQKLAARGLASAAILVNSSIVHGVLPADDDGRAVGRLLMAGGAFWEGILSLDFEIMATYALNALPPEQQQAVFARLVPELGRALFELFFWMLDDGCATRIETERVACPLLVLSGARDRGVSPAAARAIAALYGGRARLEVLPGRGHYMMLEPGWEALADRCLAWVEEVLPPL